MQYATQDAAAVKVALVEKQGFSPERVLTLTDKEATRDNILSVLTKKLADSVSANDRVFIFFAGHGATRRLSSGRTLGYVVPADADPEQTATQAIPMTDLQTIAENLPAKHVFFVMDACYSGLGLTRGGGDRFLSDNAKRIGRQMLTAGGADQLVADGGPNGHSVFTWTLLQGLDGKADLNGDGIITATELAAFVAPAVADVASQTPAFGSLPGSEGGEFVFSAPAQKDLTAGTPQLSPEAIALNKKLDKAASHGEGAPVAVPNLEGTPTLVVTADPSIQTPLQRAIAANTKGMQFYKEAQYDQAILAFKEALAAQPDYAMAANNLGFVYHKQGRYKEAIVWLEKTLKLDPSRGVAYLNLGDTLTALHDQERARQAYRTYLELVPTGGSSARVRAALATAR